jgi:hypothetical protein
VGSDHVAINPGGTAQLSFNSDAADAASSVLLYDGGTDNVLSPTGLGGLDLTQSGANPTFALLTSHRPYRGRECGFSAEVCTTKLLSSGPAATLR